MTWCRARNKEQMNERKQAILLAAKALFREIGYDGVTLNGIARAAGFTKSNIYRYFSSREEIFLHIYTDLLIGWSEKVEKGVLSSGGKVGIAEFSKILATGIEDHPLLLDLSPMLYVSLERNSSTEQLMEFKRVILQLSKSQHKLMSELFPFLTAENSHRFLIHFHSIVSGLWPASNPCDALEKIYEIEEFSSLKLDFKTELSNAISILLIGMKNQNQNQKG